MKRLQQAPELQFCRNKLLPWDVNSYNSILVTVHCSVSRNVALRRCSLSLILLLPHILQELLPSLDGSLEEIDMCIC